MEITDVRPVVLRVYSHENDSTYLTGKLIADEGQALDPKNTDISLLIAFKVSPNSITRYLVSTDWGLWHVKEVLIRWGFSFEHSGFRVFKYKLHDHKRAPTDAQITEAIRSMSE